MLNILCIVYANFAKSILNHQHTQLVRIFKTRRAQTEMLRKVRIRHMFPSLLRRRGIRFACFSVIEQVSGSQTDDLIFLSNAEERIKQLKLYHPQTRNLETKIPSVQSPSIYTIHFDFNMYHLISI